MPVEIRAPKLVEELGIPESLVHDLTLRRALYEGRTSTLRLSTALGLSLPVMTKIVEELRDLRHIEVLGIDQYDYTLELTGQGREVATERMGLCRYAGTAPVGLAQYVDVIRRQTAEPAITRETMTTAFADLVVNPQLLDELGPALLTPGAMFLYGPPGTGKTSIAERMIRVHADLIIVPRAVEVDSQIITVFDPVIHRAVDPQPVDLDPRWVLCRRPSIIAGGELQASMMDLTYEPSNGVYLAPIQMQANNGLLVIDDFGRQQMTPEELLNRWIVPLDRRIDYLALSYGVRFEIPFDVKVVFSTNLEPASLGDEAFFRRIQNKILITSIPDSEFDIVLKRAAKHHNVKIAEGAEVYLRKVSREVGDGDLRPYLPNEVCKILKAVCTYNHVEPVLNKKTIDQVANIYFTHATRVARREDPVIEDLLAQANAASAAPAATPSPPAAAPTTSPLPTQPPAEGFGGSASAASF